MSKINEQLQRIRLYAETYERQPFGREVEGTAEILREASATIESLTAELQQYRATGLTPRMIEELKEREKRSHRLAVQRATELEEYQKIGTMGECESYKIHSKNISELPSCNDCGRKKNCKKMPRLGEYCRINCFLWEAGHAAGD